MTEKELPLYGTTRQAAPSPTEKQLAKTQETKPQRDIPRCATGESADELIKAWLGWYAKGTGLPLPPQSFRARLGKQVRALIATEYSADAIKWGLAAWTMERLDNHSLPPEHLDKFVWRFAFETSPQAQAWKNRQKQLIQQFGVPLRNEPETKRQARRRRTVEALAHWTDDDDAEGATP